MVFKNCLKISYKGLTRNVICDTLLRYEDIVGKIIEAFDLTNIHRAAIQIYDEQGSKFDKEVFEYFLLLFPNPQKLFFIRLDNSKLMDVSSNNNINLDETRHAFSISKSMNKRKDTHNMNNNVEAVPVRRQNCFIGQWPGNNVTQNPTTTTTNATSTMPDNQQQHSQQNIVRGIVNRIKMFQQSHLKRKIIATTTPTIVKRSMRI
ncbi:companion of reaper [Haematobia irritans]|uniref:companion of reaper n=1 Tax=Haematobia irritans TaxID=7368 RepID=UPI003F4F92AA